MQFLKTDFSRFLCVSVPLWLALFTMEQSS